MIENKIHSKVELATFQQGKKGNEHCGDAYISVETKKYFICALADGLGSGEGARRSADIAMKIVKECHHEGVQAILEKCNRALSKERGVVITILKVYFDTNQVVYGNVGNIDTYLFLDEGSVQHPVATAGYLAGRKYKHKLEHFPFREGFYFVMHSDGIRVSRTEQEKLNRSVSPELSIKPFAEKASHTNDDTTIIIGRIT